MSIIKSKNKAIGENSVIGAGTVVNGSIKSDAMVFRVDGKVLGDIVTEGELVIGTDGVVEGNIIASSLMLGGKLTGDADVKHRIEIEAGGELLGDINTELLAMDETAVLIGRVNMNKPEPQEDEEDKKDEADE